MKLLVIGAGNTSPSPEISSWNSLDSWGCHLSKKRTYVNIQNLNGNVVIGKEALLTIYNIKIKLIQKVTFSFVTFCKPSCNVTKSSLKLILRPFLPICGKNWMLLKDLTLCFSEVFHDTFSPNMNWKPVTKFDYQILLRYMDKKVIQLSWRPLLIRIYRAIYSWV